MRVLALDYGVARCGCARERPDRHAGDADRAGRCGRRRRQGHRAARRARARARRRAGRRRAAAGPVRRGHRPDARGARVRGAAWRAALDVPVELYDERFTTRIAARAGGAHAIEDSRAAAVLLEDWLARHGAGRGPSAAAMSARTPEEREAARLERERRRAERAGAARRAARARPAPPATPRRAPSRRISDRGRASTRPSPRRPQPTQVFDVAIAEWTARSARPVATPQPAPTSPRCRSAPSASAAHERAPARAGRGRARPPAAPPRRERRRAASGRRWGRRARRARRARRIAVGRLVPHRRSTSRSTATASGRVVVRVPRGAAVGEIGDLLADRGVDRLGLLLRAAREARRARASELKSGRFTLQQRHELRGRARRARPTSPAAAAGRARHDPRGRARAARRRRSPAQAGPARRLPRGAAAARARSTRAATARRRAPTLEGFLFPATYELKRGATAQRRSSPRSWRVPAEPRDASTCATPEART